MGLSELGLVVCRLFLLQLGNIPSATDGEVFSLLILIVSVGKDCGEVNNQAAIRGGMSRRFISLGSQSIWHSPYPGRIANSNHHTESVWCGAELLGWKQGNLGSRPPFNRRSPFGDLNHLLAFYPAYLASLFLNGALYLALLEEK